MSDIPLRILKRKFIIKYLKEHPETSVVDTDFHRAWAYEFGDKQTAKAWGAQPVPTAMRYLAAMYNEGTLSRSIIGLSPVPPGFSNWVYSYTLNLPKKTVYRVYGEGAITHPEGSKSRYYWTGSRFAINRDKGLPYPDRDQALEILNIYRDIYSNLFREFGLDESEEWVD